jgi:hypothetical protein
MDESNGNGAQVASAVPPRQRVDLLPEDFSPQTRSLYYLVFWILGISLIGCIAGWIAIVTMGKTVPEGLPVVVATIVGGLVGVITPASSAKKQ